MLMFRSCTVSNLRDGETLTNQRDAYYVELLGVMHRSPYLVNMKNNLLN